MQAQLKKRAEKDNHAQEIIRYTIEERINKANLLNKKGEKALEKVKQQQRRYEVTSVKKYRQHLKETEARLQSDLQTNANISLSQKKLFIQKEQNKIEQTNLIAENENMSVVQNLYNIESKLNTGQKRAQYWQTINKNRA